MTIKKTELNTSVNQWIYGSIVVAVLAFVGCAATQQPRGPMSSGVEKSGFLQDLYPKMQEGEKPHPFLFYQNPRTETLAADAYNKMVLDTVTIYGSESKLKDVPQDQLQNLATMFGAQLADKLSTYYELVHEPGPKTLQIQTALTDAQATDTTLHAISFVPIPLGVPGLKIVLLKSKELATGKPVFAGEVTAEMKIMDAQSGEVLFAGVDRRVGGRLGGGWKSWTDAEEGFRYFAENVRYGLCRKLRHQTDCVAPKE